MDAKHNRRQHLLRIIETKFKGNSGQCADFLGIKRPQLSRWITRNESARQGISEDSARNIEQMLGLRSGVMDTDTDAPATPGQQASLIEALELLTPEQLSDLVAQIKERAETKTAVLESLSAAPSVRVRAREIKNAGKTPFIQRRRKEDAQ